MIGKGFVAIFSKPLTKKIVSKFIESWLERFEKVEQVTPVAGHSLSTLEVKSIGDLMWEENLQFRVLNGSEFAWVYLSLEQRAIETTGLPSEEISLCLDVLLELEGVTEIIDATNERRLDQLEKEGVL